MQNRTERTGAYGPMTAEDAARLASIAGAIGGAPYWRPPTKCARARMLLWMWSRLMWSETYGVPVLVTSPAEVANATATNRTLARKFLAWLEGRGELVRVGRIADEAEAGALCREGTTCEPWARNTIVRAFAWHVPGKGVA